MITLYHGYVSKTDILNSPFWTSRIPYTVHPVKLTKRFFSDVASIEIVHAVLVGSYGHKPTSKSDGYRRNGDPDLQNPMIFPDVDFSTRSPATFLVEFGILAPIETALELRLANNDTKSLGNGVGDSRNRSDGSPESKSRPKST